MPKVIHARRDPYGRLVYRIYDTDSGRYITQRIYLSERVIMFYRRWSRVSGDEARSALSRAEQFGSSSRNIPPKADFDWRFWDRERV